MDTVPSKPNLPAARPKGTALSVQIPARMPEWLIPKGGDQPVLTTLDITSDAGFALVNRATLMMDAKLVQEVNLTINVAHVVLTPYEGEDDDTGEEKSSVRIALIDTDGLVHTTYSSGVRQSVINLLKRGKWPVKVKVGSIGIPLKNGKSGNKLYLDLVPE